MSRRGRLGHVSDGSRGTDGVIIDASAASMFNVAWTAPSVRWREAPPMEQPLDIFWSLSVQTTRRSNLALAGKRFNHFYRLL